MHIHLVRKHFNINNGICGNSLDFTANPRVHFVIPLLLKLLNCIGQKPFQLRTIQRFFLKAKGVHLIAFYGILDHVGNKNDTDIIVDGAQRTGCLYSGYISHFNIK